MVKLACQEEQKNSTSGQEWSSFTKGFVKKHFYFYIQSAKQGSDETYLKVTLRVHGNSKWIPSSASSVETVESVVKFI